MVRYAEYTTAEKSPIKRWSHSTRFRVALAVLQPLDSQSLLDFGTADALMIKLVKATHPAVACVGYDPHMDEGAGDVSAEFRDVELVTDIGALAGRRFDIVTCFETLEHFTTRAANERVDEIVGLAKPDGRIVVSVPIEIGPASLFKNVVRAAIGKPHPGTTVASVMASLFYRPVERPAEKAGGYIPSHVGFDYRVVPGLFAARGWHCVRTHYSPLGGAGPLFNSQALFEFRRREGLS